MQKQLLLHKLTMMNSKIKNKHKCNKNREKDINITIDNTLFILDWDDTLFPTSWTTKNNVDIINAESRDRYIEHFKTLDRALSTFLKNIKQYGKVIIVTNAMTEWVKVSSIVLPDTYHVLRGINIVSAKNLFSDQTKDVMEWKKRTFKLIIDKEFEDKKLMNVISAGDMHYEHHALVSLTQSYFDKIKYLKSFRLIKNPTYDELLEEIELLDNYIHKFVGLHKQLCKTFKFNHEL
jgi:hypothetical protein